MHPPYTRFRISDWVHKQAPLVSTCHEHNPANRYSSPVALIGQKINTSYFGTRAVAA